MKKIITQITQLHKILSYIIAFLVCTIHISNANYYDVPSFDIQSKITINTNEFKFRLNLIRGQGVTISLSPTITENKNMYLYLYDQHDAQLKSKSYIKNKQTGVIDYVASHDGIYYVKATCDTGCSGSFIIGFYNAWFNPGISDTDRNFYSSFYTARHLKSASYTIDAERPKYYRMIALENKPFTISVIPAINENKNIYLYLYDQDLTQLQSKSYISNLKTGTINYTPSLTGVYYLKVSSDTDTTGYFDLTFSNINSYPYIAGVPDFPTASNLTFTVNAQNLTHFKYQIDNGSYSNEYPVLQEIQLNDLVDGEHIISVIGKDLNGNWQSDSVEKKLIVNTTSAQTEINLFDLSFNVPIDRNEWQYTFNLKRGQGITASITPYINENKNFYLYIYDQDNQQLYQKSYIKDNQTDYIDYMATVDGKYYVKVSCDTNTHGIYHIGFYNAWFNPGISDTDRDFYSSGFTSRHIQKGNYSVNDQRPDYYQFTAFENEALYFEVIPNINENKNLHLYLYDQDFNQLKSKSYISDNQTGSINYSPSLTGVYYLKVSSDNGTRGTYNLSFSNIQPHPFIAGLPDYPTGSNISFTVNAQNLTQFKYQLDNGTYSNEYPVDHTIQLENIADGAHIISVIGKDSDGNWQPVNQAVTKSWIVDTTSFQSEINQWDISFNVSVDREEWQFPFYLEKDQGITIALSPYINESKNCYLYLYNQDDQNLVQKSYIKNNDTGSIDFQALNDGMYYAKVVCDSNTHGFYHIGFYNAWFNPGITDSNRNFYSSYFTARSISQGAYLVDSARPDYFLFIAFENTDFTIQILPSINENKNIYLYLYDQDFQELKSISYISDNQNGIMNYKP
ncbi:MAG: hypothetical protein OMM_10083, partial [Candidatus Magnetoglobus multicellularis str. Araruama]